MTVQGVSAEVVVLLKYFSERGVHHHVVLTTLKWWLQKQFELWLAAVIDGMLRLRRYANACACVSQDCFVDIALREASLSMWCQPVNGERLQK